MGWIIPEFECMPTKDDFVHGRLQHDPQLRESEVLRLPGLNGRSLISATSYGTLRISRKAPVLVSAPASIHWARAFRQIEFGLRLLL
jgi:hypothetical protein